jgi:hypothetical protein
MLIRPAEVIVKSRQFARIVQGKDAEEIGLSRILDPASPLSKRRGR